jgi:ABC-type amino acid transport substrate-binding protein
MQCPRPKLPHGNRVRIATFVIAFLAAAVAPLAGATSASTATLDRVRQTGKLTLGYRADARPFSYRDESGNAAGYSVALCQKIAEQVKADLGLSTLAVEWTPVTVGDQFRVVQENKVDLVCGAAETLTRRKDIAFSVPIFLGGIGALLHAHAPIGLREVLSGRQPSEPLWRGSPAQILEKQVFSVVAGSTTETWLAGRLDKFQLTAKVVPVDGYDAGIRRVLDRSSNVFFGDRSILLDAAKRRSPGELLVLERQFTSEPLALALERGDEEFRLLVDRTLSHLFGSDELHGLYVKWFGEPDESAIMFFRLSTLPE